MNEKKKKSLRRVHSEISPLVPSGQRCGDESDRPFDSKQELLSNKRACRSLDEGCSDAALLEVAQTLILGRIIYYSSVLGVKCVVRLFSSQC